MPTQEPTRRLSSRAVKVGMVSTLSLTLVACGSSTTARCVDKNAPPTGKGGYKVVSDSYCDVDDIDNGSSYHPYGRYFWYYGGKRGSNGYVSGGTQTRPDGKIKSSGGRTLSRGGFGGGGRGGG